MKIGERIKSIRQSLGYSQTEFADKINVSKQTLYKYENNIITNIPSDKIEEIAKISGVNPAYIMGWFENTDILSSDNMINKYENLSPIEVRSIPLLGEIACGKPVYADENFQYYVKAGAEIEADFCLRAKGDSMINARIQDGDIIFIRKQPSVDDGEIAAVCVNDDEATLKRVYYKKDVNLLMLVAENPAYPTQVYQGEELDHVHILGKAIAFQSDIK